VRRLTEREDFGMSGGVLEADRAVMAPPHDLLVQEHDGSNRDFSLRFRFSRFCDRFLHPKFRRRKVHEYLLFSVQPSAIRLSAMKKACGCLLKAEG
jgi:hypothetical protein